MNPAPITDLTKIETPIPNDHVDQIQMVADNIPQLIRTHRLREALQTLPIVDVAPLEACDDFRIIERFFQIYAHFANGFIWCEQDDPMTFLPASVAMPFVQLGHLVERPPIVPYAMTALSNYQKVDPHGNIEADNLRVVQKMIDIPDESWFHLIHVEIEARAAKAIAQIGQIRQAIEQHDLVRIEAGLNIIAKTFEEMMKTFKRMPEQCSPDRYFHTLRPYLFGFNNIVYEGVAEFGGKPQTLHGETGAQSSIIPALKAFLGLQHSHGGLTEYLEIMKRYMPKPHRQFLAQIDPQHLRQFVSEQENHNLTTAYNHCLEKMVAFRSQHLHFANAYIASKVDNPTGTGGTDFMRWLTQLRDETTRQFL